MQLALAACGGESEPAAVRTGDRELGVARDVHRVAGTGEHVLAPFERVRGAVSRHVS